MTERLGRVAAGRKSRWVIVAAWLLLALALAPLQPRLQDLAADENEAFLADAAESTRVNDLVDDRFELGREVTAIVAYSRPGGPLTEADYQRIDADMRTVCDAGAIRDLESVVTPRGPVCGELGASLAPETPPSQVSDDGSIALVTVSTTNERTDVVVADVLALRARLPGPDADGLRTYVTGEGGFTADASEAFEGIDRTLLAATLVLVLVLLLATYRSPVAALVPLVVVVVAYVIAAGAIYALADAGAFRVTGQATAILIVLMFGAGTDYCLLLVSRFREEQAATADPREAMERATARSGRSILSAGATVVAAMLVLTLADYRATSSMGPVLALGVTLMVLAGLTLLPALLAVLGRRAFWPATAVAPRPRGSVWDGVAALVRRRPGAIAGAVLAVLCLGALGNMGSRGTLDFTESFRTDPESVRGLDVIRAGFGPGRAAPAQLLVETRRLPETLAAVTAAPAVAAATPVSYSDDQALTLIDVELAADPFSAAATDSVPELRALVRDAAAAGTALLGGLTAENHDARRAQSDDALLIVPLTLALVLLIVMVLLRAVVAPLFLVATVVLSFAFALGASSLVFEHLLGQPESDPGLPLFAFIFLVALGVDYNIFLVGRIREEPFRVGTREAVARGLRHTGGVITSAGLILAGTFAVLMALPVESLFQAGFTIALGILVDTFAVRALLVPSLAMLLGARTWWPGRPFAEDQAEVR